MFAHRFFPTTIKALFAVFLHFSLATFALADTILAPGDRVSFVVIGSRELDTIATVETNGSVTLPFIGPVTASGLTVDELRQSIAEVLKQTPISMQVDGEQATWKRIEPTTIFVSVVEYRPVFVTGHVRFGGAHPYRPGMTTRQALVLAGGLGQAEEDATGNNLGKLLSERQVLGQRRDHAWAEVARVQAELAAIQPGKTFKFPKGASQPPKKLSYMSEQWIAARAELRSLTAASNALALKQMQERLSILEELKTVSEKTLETYEEELERLQTLAERGIATNNSVTEAQRGLLSFSSRALEATSEAYKVKTDITRLMEQSQAAETRERSESLHELLQLLARAKEIEAQISAVEFQMSLAGEVGQEPKNLTTKVTIFRKMQDGEKRLDAQFDTSVAPGDVIEFRLIVEGDG